MAGKEDEGWESVRKVQRVQFLGFWILSRHLRLWGGCCWWRLKSLWDHALTCPIITLLYMSVYYPSNVRENDSTIRNLRGNVRRNAKACSRGSGNVIAAMNFTSWTTLLGKKKQRWTKPAVDPSLEACPVWESFQHGQTLEVKRDKTLNCKFHT